ARARIKSNEIPRAVGTKKKFACRSQKAGDRVAIVSETRWKNVLPDDLAGFVVDRFDGATQRGELVFFFAAQAHRFIGFRHSLVVHRVGISFRYVEEAAIRAVGRRWPVGRPTVTRRNKGARDRRIFLRISNGTAVLVQSLCPIGGRSKLAREQMLTSDSIEDEEVSVASGLYDELARP